MGMEVSIRDDYQRSKKRSEIATRLLLALLKEHHDYDIKKPEEAPKPKIVATPPAIPKDIQPAHIEELPSRQGKIREFSADAGWFSIEDIKRKVCDYFNFTHEELISPAKPARLVYARQIGIFLACRYGKKSYAETGRRFGDRDHQTVIYAYNKIKRGILIDSSLAYDVAHIEAVL